MKLQLLILVATFLTMILMLAQIEISGGFHKLLCDLNGSINDFLVLGIYLVSLVFNTKSISFFIERDALPTALFLELVIFIVLYLKIVPKIVERI